MDHGFWQTGHVFVSCDSESELVGQPEKTVRDYI